MRKFVRSTLQIKMKMKEGGILIQRKRGKPNPSGVPKVASSRKRSGEIVAMTGQVCHAGKLSRGECGRWEQTGVGGQDDASH